MTNEANKFGSRQPWQPEEVARFFSALTIPYLAPEIQLLYKSKNPRPRDEADFVRTFPALDGKRRQWLAQSLALVHPGHVWLTKLT